jgi:hypothetical protein
MKSILTILVAIGLAGCASPAGESVSPTSEPTESATEEPTASAESPVPSDSEVASPSASVEAETTITGQLSSNDIEGGCVFVTADDGTDYEVIWPEGWSISPDSLELTDPDGEVVAEGGDQVTVYGRIADDMASICQIGPIFEAVEVEVAE